MSDFRLLSGQTDKHLVTDPELNCQLHARVAEPFGRLRRVARAAGFDMAVASSFRSFARQCVIWNEKVAGLRPVLDDDGRPVDLGRLNNWGKVQAILRWSALPGASRHHWGTDLDVFDRCRLDPSHRGPALTAAECEPGGPFHPFHKWLSTAIACDRAFGFYRPYAVDRGGVGCEPWHISYRPVAADYQQALSAALLREVVSQSEIALRATILAHIDEIHARFVSLP